jgi:type IX secretion system PorP/SprF family membrane protein
MIDSLRDGIKTKKRKIMYKYTLRDGKKISLATFDFLKFSKQLTERKLCENFQKYPEKVARFISVKLLIVLLSFCFSSLLLAQDPHFSFFSGNALGTNPALTGQTNNYNSRLQTSYRNQWSTILGEGAFQTAFVSYDRRICIPFFEGVFIGVGGSVVGDIRGVNELQRVDAMGSAALIVTLDANSDYNMYLSAGAEAGWIGHRVGIDNLTFDDQFTTPGLAPEITALASSNVADFGAGATFSRVSKRDHKGADVQAGIAIKHLTKPPLTYYETSDDLTPRLEQQVIYHLGLSVITGEKIRIPIRAIYRVQQPHRQLLASMGVQYKMTDRTDLQASGGIRLSRSFDGFRQDAFIPSLSVYHDKYQVTASYDLSLSNLRQASAYVGSLELMVSYLFGNGDCKFVYCKLF